MAELHRLERKLLLALKIEKRLSVDEIKKKTRLSEDSITRATLWLSSKKLVEVEDKKRTFIKLDIEGLKFLEKGLPERLLIETILKLKGKASLSQTLKTSRLDEGEVNIAIGWAKRKKWLTVQKRKGKIALEVEKEPELGSDERLIKVLGRDYLPLDELPTNLLDGVKLLEKRPNAIILSEKTERFLNLTNKGLKVAQEVKEIEEVSQLTPELIRTGRWREVKLRKYNIKAPVERIWPGKKQPYKRFLDELKWKLIVLGFKEMTGPIVELMFFNCDALFMPQDHPAREIHDMYFVKSPLFGDLDAYKSILENVKESHENGWKTGSKGWRYKFSVQEAKRLILRSQGTSLSARTLIRKDLEVPGKYFSIIRCYRPDVVDKTHLTEFNQIEGIVVGKELTFRDLLGVLEKFALEIAGADKVRFRPDYFPFTEPSVELSAYKRGSGWLEFGGAGMFRPEVTLPLGISVPVIAWGLGIDRLFMMKARIDDIRYLFTQDLDWLRRQELM